MLSEQPAESGCRLLAQPPQPLPLPTPVPRAHGPGQVGGGGQGKPVTQNISTEAWGRADCGVTSVSYQQGVLSATLLYEILLGKATLLPVLVRALVLMAMVKEKDS